MQHFYTAPLRGHATPAAALAAAPKGYAAGPGPVGALVLGAVRAARGFLKAGGGRGALAKRACGSAPLPFAHRDNGISTLDPPPSA
jgi:hypothetical protein